jgi:hypothetical protein
MSEEPQTPKQQAAEAAAIRRRWITLGEVLAVVAVLISALTLWNSYTERTRQEADRLHDEQKAGAKAATLTLKATPVSGGRALTLATIRPEQVIQGQNIAFPTPLDVRAVETAGDARIEADWFGDRLKKARLDAGMDERTRGDARLPVAITTHYLVDGTPRTDVAIYDIGYVLGGKLFGGATIHLRGLSLVERTTDEKARARIDALWKARSSTK